MDLVIDSILSAAQVAKANMRRAFDGNPRDQQFGRRQGDELNKFLAFEQRVQTLAAQNKLQCICANRTTIRRVIDEAETLKMNADIYTSLLALKC